MKRENERVKRDSKRFLTSQSQATGDSTMTRLSRTNRRAAIGRVEQLDERIALSGMAAASISGPIAYPVSAVPPFVYTHQGHLGSDGTNAPVNVVNGNHSIPITRASLATSGGVLTMSVPPQINHSPAPGEVFFTVPTVTATTPHQPQINHSPIRGVVFF
jgi:hypothetical protein